MNVKSITAAILLAATLSTAPFFAPQGHAQQVTKIKVKAKKPLIHKESGITLPYKMAGYERDSAASYSPTNLNISAQFSPKDESEFFSIYIFRATNGNAPIWFDRANYAITSRNIFGDLTPISAAQPFTPTGQNQSSGLQIIYDAKGKGFKSTGLMFFQMGEFYIKIRASSKIKNGEELKKWMEIGASEIIAPKNSRQFPIAVPVQPCATKMITFEDAQIIKSDDEEDMSAGIYSALLGMTDPSDISAEGAEAAEQAPATWCRDDQYNAPPGAIYRAGESMNSYLLAFGDSGNALSVGPNDLIAAINAADTKSADDAVDRDQEGIEDQDTLDAPPISITIIVEDKKVHFSPRNKLPSPNLVMKILDNESPVSSNGTWGKNKNNVNIFTK
ncbi:hypothetical protein LPB140_11680 [Sphingorhabdus lutea]|uniref:Uncharacterized protein n=1 Tax=Sphingorhabdus lutea TaxID=1913578 RepID=A0A1L3JDW9_9SPHN|nr:hypothetical protein [Sphingorhabdus lutea]APG63338.1 hypothetical protein LPB140_11680 [Sphingorhabdus lutea]